MNQFLRVKTFIYRILVLMIPKPLIQTVIKEFLLDKNVYYSQEGEDIIVARYFKGKTSGFFVDVGAHHPTRFSNTYKLYLSGWTGINIDATPGSMIPFLQMRPKDINLEVGVSDVENELNYYQFSEPALNTFSKERMEFILKETPYKLVHSIKQKTQRLDKILDQYLTKNQTIDFLTIDVEGLDLNILESNDWNKYRPQMILVEDLYKSLDEINNSKCYQYLKKLDYTLTAKTFNTLLYSDSKKTKNLL